VKCSLLNKEYFYNICLELGLKNNINNNVWIGFSGGLDSSVMLYLSYLVFSNNLNYKLYAVYINHGVNKNANYWQQYCQTICKKFNIEFKAIPVTADPKQIKEFGLEAALRICRKEVWQKLLAPQDTLLLAHHLNDQAETVFLRLLRGSGLTGLGAIHPVCFFDKVKIIRPLLHFTRQELECFAKQHNLSYITDDSNYDQKFTRNFLRHEIFPKLITKWPKCINNIGRTVKHLQQADLFIKHQASIALMQCCKNLKFKNILIISELLKYDSFLQAEILRMFIIKQGFNPPDEAKLNKIYTEIIAAKIDRQPKLNLRQYVIYRYRDQLYVYSTEYLNNNDLNRKKLSFKTILDDLNIYFGDSINLVGANKAKKIFQNLGVPPWQRKDYPLVFQQGKLIAILGLWVKKEK
jgi:tRNA(Ile)-lysidine synthase